MMDVFPMDFVVENSLQAHGYTIFEVIGQNPFFRRDSVFKGHEFHYSHAVNINSEAIHFVYKMKRGKGIADGYDGVVYKNVLATYSHLHALGTDDWAKGIIEASLNYKRQNK